MTIAQTITTTKPIDAEIETAKRKTAGQLRRPGLGASIALRMAGSETVASPPRALHPTALDDMSETDEGQLSAVVLGGPRSGQAVCEVVVSRSQSNEAVA